MIWFCLLFSTEAYLWMSIQWFAWISPLPTCCICQCRRILFLLEVCFATRFFIHAIHSSLSCRFLCYLCWLLQQKLRFFLLLPLSILTKSEDPAFCSLYISSLRPLQNICLQEGLAWITAKVSSSFQIHGIWARTPNAASYYYRSDSSGIRKG